MIVNNNDISSPRLRASQAAFEATEAFSKQSKLAKVEERGKPVSWTDVREQCYLGKGAFSEVYRADVDAPELKGRNYALKFLSREITNADFDLAAIDLAMEADILSRLNHDNIITLHGVFGGEMKSSYVDSKRGYFLILDLLEDTLPKHLARCRAMERKKLSLAVSNKTLVERIENVALGIAKGMEYLHDNGVVFRDLKPDNVGFTREGTPVIFDFGFARELHMVQQGEIAGSLRYMSPEMAFAQDPSFPSDVYSFGVLLFEICTLQRPFKQFKDRSDFKEHVLLGDYRPSLSSIRSKSIKDVISKSWDPDQTKRPDMKSIVKVLRVETALSDAQILSDSQILSDFTRTRSASFAGTPNLNRRNNLSNFKWDSVGKTAAPRIFKRSSSRESVVSSVDLEKEGNCVSELSLADLVETSKRRQSFKKRLSWSRSSFDSMGSESTSFSKDSNMISSHTLGQLRKPFKRLSFRRSSSKSALQDVE